MDCLDPRFIEQYAAHINTFMRHILTGASTGYFNPKYECGPTCFFDETHDFPCLIAVKVAPDGSDSDFLASCGISEGK